jgi:hypothetical protein
VKRRGELAWAGALVALKVLAMVWALRCGFAQVSDDDYARTVIAQTFAHAPRLDPSGTSWLPFPFWLYGGVMALFGRSLGVARGLAFVLGALSPLVAWAGLRSMRVPKPVAFGGAALSALTPWAVWLGLAPVPEGWAGVCAAAALFFAPQEALVAGALALVSSLARYEAWPVAALVACVLALRAVRGPRARRARLAIAALLAAVGPLFWLANNAVAHGDALHFVARVTAYRRAHGGTIPLGARLLEYPRALVDDAPELVVVAAIGALGAALSSELRRRWALPLGGAALVLAFLIYGDVRDGAPTHHAVRALVPVLVVLGGFGASGAEALARAWRPLPARAAVGLAAAAWLAFVLARTRDVPGNAPDARRTAQIARGRALAGAARTLEVTPCAYEHFALIAAFGAPERVKVAPPTHAPVTAACPRVVARSNDP